MVTNVYMSLVFFANPYSIFFHTMTYLSGKLIEIVTGEKVSKASRVPKLVDPIKLFSLLTKNFSVFLLLS